MLFLSIWFSFSSCLRDVTSRSCGVDNSPVSHIYEDRARIEDYPWVGVVYYPYNRHKFTTAVVLVTRQIVLAAATEIDKLPKEHFRDHARVIIGHNCTGPHVGVRDYTYHPDFAKDTYSTLAIIQLEIDHATIELRPICPPPRYFKDQNVYAMVLSDNCRQSKVTILKMKYVYRDQCKSFYMRSGLDVDTLWPSHTICAKSQSGGHCVWRSGTILAAKVEKRWRLLGFGVYGPGCQAPARFLDYGMYHEWVQRSIARIGRPAITNLADNHVVFRRTFTNFQRFGPCLADEMKMVLYNEETKVEVMGPQFFLRRNLTIIANVEYSCVILKADYDYEEKSYYMKPKMRIRRWCSYRSNICYGLNYMEMHFYIEIFLRKTVNLKIKAYGRKAKIIKPTLSNIETNRFKVLPTILSYIKTKELVKRLLTDPEYPMYGKNIKI